MVALSLDNIYFTIPKTCVKFNTNRRCFEMWNEIQKYKNFNLKAFSCKAGSILVGMENWKIFYFKNCHKKSFFPSTLLHTSPALASLNFFFRKALNCLMSFEIPHTLEPVIRLTAGSITLTNFVPLAMHVV